MTTDKLRVGVVGCGGIARAHAQAYRENDAECELVACVDVAADSANAFAEEYGCVAYPTTQEMLEGARPDAISICTPPDGHLPITRAAAKRGVAVLCEKPLARNQAEAEQMVTLVEASGIVFMNALCHRFHGPMQQARELLERGEIGTPIHFYNRFAFRFEGVENRWFVQREIAGGGILLDTAVHSVDIFRYLIGEVAAVSARLSTTLPIEVEDSAALLLQSTTGVTGEISCSWVTPPGESLVRVYGTQGVLEVDYAASPNLRYRTDGEWTAVPYQGPDRFHGEVRHFLQCVRSKAAPLVSVHEGARTVAVLQAAYRSAGIE